MLLFLFVFGLFIGSFLLVLIDRIPRNETFIKGHSHCEYCHHVLAWYDLVPLVSFLLTNGKCRYCNKKISLYYPFLELITGLLFVLTFVYLPLSHVVYSAQNIVTLVYYLFIISSFIVIFFIDLKNGIIPDKITYSGVGVSLLYLLFFFPTLFVSHVLCGLAAFAFFLLLFLVTRGRGMGLGDVKLVFWLGLILGFPLTVFALYFAFIFGAVIALLLIAIKKKHFRGSTLPFGPFLVLGAVAMLFFGDHVIQYIHIFL